MKLYTLNQIDLKKLTPQVIRILKGEQEPLLGIEKGEWIETVENALGETYSPELIPEIEKSRMVHNYLAQTLMNRVPEVVNQKYTR